MKTRYTWTPEKAARNLKVHGITFDTAKNVFSDPHVRYLDDCDYDGESRYHAIGFVNARLMVVVVYVDRSDENEEIIHIISARKAEAIEETFYAAQF